MFWSRKSVAIYYPLTRRYESQIPLFSTRKWCVAGNPFRDEERPKAIQWLPCLLFLVFYKNSTFRGQVQRCDLSSVSFSLFLLQVLCFFLLDPWQGTALAGFGIVSAVITFKCHVSEEPTIRKTAVFSNKRKPSENLIGRGVPCSS